MLTLKQMTYTVKHNLDEFRQFVLIIANNDIFDQNICKSDDLHDSRW